MLVAGSDDGVYRIAGVREPGETTAEKVLDAGRVLRVRRFDALDGVFAATESGLYRSLDGREWTNLGVPSDEVYAVCVNPAGDRLYAGTRPARVYVSTSVSRDSVQNTDGPEWRELDGFRELRSRHDWGLDRHDGVAQVRSLCTHPDAPNRVVAGVEVGGIHVSEDDGETWTERKDGVRASEASAGSSRAKRSDGVHDDVHHLHAVSGDEYVAATGFGLYRTTDAGRSWTRLDRHVEQRYFRESYAADGVLYAGGAHGSSSTWDEETDHAILARRDGGTLEELPSPTPDELVLGWCGIDDGLLAATHRGTLLQKQGDDWRKAGRVPVPGEVAGRYLPLAWYEP